MCFVPRKSAIRGDIPLIYCKVSLSKPYFTKCKLKAASGGVGAPSADTIRKRKRRAEDKARKEADIKRKKLLRELNKTSVQSGINAGAASSSSSEIYAPVFPTQSLLPLGSEPLGPVLGQMITILPKHKVGDMVIICPNTAPGIRNYQSVEQTGKVTSIKCCDLKYLYKEA